MMITWGIDYVFTHCLLVFTNCAFQIDIINSLRTGCFASLPISGELWQLTLGHVGPVPELSIPLQLIYQLWRALSVAQLDFSDICADAQGDLRVNIPGILATFPQVKHFIKTVSPIVILFFFTFSLTSSQWFHMIVPKNKIATAIIFLRVCF